MDYNTHLAKSHLLGKGCAILVHDLEAEARMARPFFESTVGYNKMAATCNNNKLVCSYILDIDIE